MINMFPKKKKVDRVTKKKTADDKNKVKPKHDETPIKKPFTNVISQQVKPTPEKFGSGRIKSDIEPLNFTDEVPEKPPIKPPRIYPNRQAHPELQDINLSAGYHSALMKQLEIHEELYRALIDIQIAGLPEITKKEMLKKYGMLI